MYFKGTPSIRTLCDDEYGLFLPGAVAHLTPVLFEAETEGLPEFELDLDKLSY